MSSPKLSNITNSMQYSALWMCLQWVCWIILLNKCVLRENSKNMVLNRGRKYNPTDCCESTFITTLHPLLDSLFAPLIMYTEPWFVISISWYFSASEYPQQGEWGQRCGQTVTIESVCLLSVQTNTATDRLWSAYFQVLFFLPRYITSCYLLIASLETPLFCIF